MSIGYYSSYIKKPAIGHDGCVAKPVGADNPRRFETPREIFGLAITELRTARRKSQATVAAAVGCEVSWLREIEQGTRNFSFDLEHDLIDYFEMLPHSKFWVFAEDLARSRRQ